MRVLLDTQLLVWLSSRSELLSPIARLIIEDEQNEVFFSAAAVWAVAIKYAQRRADFDVDPGVLRRNLLDNYYVELPVTGRHAARVATLPEVHKDPFDRLLIAQAMVEGMLLVTADAIIARYPGPIRLVPRGK